MKAVIDELVFRSYVHNRMMSPDISPERWALIYGPSVADMEERYLKTFILKMMEAAEEFDVASPGRPNNGLKESITVGNEGVGSVHTEGQLPSPSASVEGIGFETVSERPRTDALGCLNAAPSADSLKVSCHRVSGYTLYERISAVMADANFIRSAKGKMSCV
jgi:hypothetical protein